MTAWLHVIGVGERGPADLPNSVRFLLGYAETIIGPPRFLEAVQSMTFDVARREEIDPEAVRRRSMDAIAKALLEEGDGDDVMAPAAVFSDGRTLIEWEPPIERMIRQVLRLRERPTAILATGDPMWFGIGATLSNRLAPGEYVIHPYPSAFQFAAARLRWPLQAVETVSLHGRPVEALAAHILPNNRVLALTTDRSTIDQVLEILVNRGYGRSLVWALENLGAPDERISGGEADGFDTSAVGDFYVLGIDCVPEPGAALLPTVPGLPDAAFLSDGQLTKREVRAATMARLAPYPGALLWDVGSGSGSIGIEWMRAVRGARAIAFERDNDRLRMIASNAAALGTPGLQIEPGEAPFTFAAAEIPDAVFIGGAVSDDTVFDAAWQALKPGGRLVANAVTVEGEQALFARQERLGGELVRIDVASLDTVGRHRVMRPRMGVLQWSVEKALHGLVVLP